MQRRYVIHIETDEGRRVVTLPIEDFHNLRGKVVQSIHDDLLRQDDVPRMQGYAIVANLLKMSVVRVRAYISQRNT